MKVYISGKITGLPQRRVEKTFNDAEEYLRIEGFTPMNPAKLSPGFDYEDYMHICLSMIDVCEAIYMLPTWTDSPGAKEELKYAQINDKKIIWGEEE